MNRAFRIEQGGSGEFDYFSFYGTIDAAAEPRLKELPREVRRPVVKLDFSNTGRINSMGIALLLRCLRSIKDGKNADIRLVNPNEMNTMLFKMTGMLLLARLES